MRDGDAVPPQAHVAPIATDRRLRSALNTHAGGAAFGVEAAPVPGTAHEAFLWRATRRRVRFASSKRCSARSRQRSA